MEENGAAWNKQGKTATSMGFSSRRRKIRFENAGDASHIEKHHAKTTGAFQENI